MSLVGSLEDLNLGDILQIVSLSRKSGILLLRAGSRRGRIVLIEGQVRGGSVEGVPSSLYDLLRDGGHLSEEELKLAADAAEAQRISLDEAVAVRTSLDAARLASLRQEQVENAVLTMLGWRTGEFNFEVRSETEAGEEDILLPSGINAQYLAMEATRLGDEEPDEPPQTEVDPLSEGFVFSGEEAAEVPVAQELDAAATQVPVGVEGEDGDTEEEEDTAFLVRAGTGAPAPAPAPAGAPPPRVPLVAVDPELAVLEWLKGALEGRFARIHVFQDAELGLGRVRQYLARLERPVVLLGAGGSAKQTRSMVRRLHRLAPGLPVLLLRDSRSEAADPGHANGVVLRPPVHELANRRRWQRLEPAANVLREALAPWAERAPEPAKAAPPAPLERLKQASRKLRDPSNRSDVLGLVLEFAAELFSRVAIFMVRDGTAVGLAQIGLAKAGGPEDEALEGISVAVARSASFRAAIAERAAQRLAPIDPGDRRLVELLGDGLPAEIYVAPIESGGEVAALLYGDDLPANRPLGDTTALDVILEEAGLALDRALLERALADGKAGDPEAEGPA